jgi:hypothetical protein
MHAADEAPSLDSPELWGDVRKQMKKAHKKFGKCPDGYFYQPPPTLMVNDSVEQCRIEGYVDGELQDMSLDDAQAAANSCLELVEADYASAIVERGQCLEQSESDNGDQYVEQLITQEQARIESLEGHLLQYWSACSVVADAKAAREIAEVGLDALKDDPMLAKKLGKRIPKRSTKGN